MFTRAFPAPFAAPGFTVNLEKSVFAVKLKKRGAIELRKLVGIVNLVK